MYQRLHHLISEIGLQGQVRIPKLFFATKDVICLESLFDYDIIGNLYGSVVQPFEDVNLHLFDKLKNFYYQNTFIALLLSFILLFIYIVLIKENNNK
jgi:hypothetical protein